MNKRIFLSFLLVLSIGFSGCNKGSEPDDNGNKTTVPEGGVLINGVVWAKCNVDAPGIFAAKPEDFGMFYQWNRMVAWPATGGVTNWNESTPTGSIWVKSNDPSPAGWRVPTSEEIQKLVDTNKVTNERTTVNGIVGKKFTDKATGNSIFLPAVGNRSSGGYLDSGGGIYWSSEQNGSESAYTLEFNSTKAYEDSANRACGLSIRCVAE